MQIECRRPVCAGRPNAVKIVRLLSHRCTYQTALYVTSTYVNNRWRLLHEYIHDRHRADAVLQTHAKDKRPRRSSAVVAP
jgi:hypothetical protein